MVDRAAVADGEMPAVLVAAIRHVASSLRTRGIDAPDQEARELVLTATGLAPLDLVRAPARPLDAGDVARIGCFLSRRLAHEPLTRIAGEREFHGRLFHLTAATLDPRPDTETLVQAALDIVAAEPWRERPIRLLDLGTGSGCILITLLAELPLATGVGIDIVPQAVETARRNAERLGVGQRAAFELADGPSGMAGRFDLVVSNPPYIPSGEIAGLEPEVRLFDPLAALDGGEDGLAYYRRWIPEAFRLVPDGWIALEVGAGQADAVSGLLAEARPGAGCPQARRWQDLGGHTRVVALRTQS